MTMPAEIDTQLATGRANLETVKHEEEIEWNGMLWKKLVTYGAKADC